jgi:hypothetical protein
MTGETGSAASPRRRPRGIILLGAIAAGLILVAGTGYWAVIWGPLRSAPEPLRSGPWPGAAG